MTTREAPEDPVQAAKLRGLMAAFLVCLALAVGLAVTGIAYLAYQSYNQGRQNGEELKQIERVNDFIVDCTTPEGECFQEDQANRRDTVSSINEVVLYAAACADRPNAQSALQIEECIVDSLAGR